jgi:hypothetical protein
MNIVKPLTVRLLIYGQKANLAAIKKRAVDLLKDEHGKADPALFIEKEADAVFNEINEQRSDKEVPLKKPGKSMLGLEITLPDVNERMANEWMYEIPVAKTCQIFATWFSHKDNLHWQLLIADGGRWSDSRPPE